MSLCKFVIGVDCMTVTVMRLSIRMRICVKSINTFEVKMDVLMKIKQEGIRMN